MSAARYGTSWPGHRPGTRHWVTVPLSDLALGWLVIAAFWVLFAPVLLGLWLYAEVAVLTVCAAALIASVIRRDARWRNNRWQRLRFGLWALRMPPAAHSGGSRDWEPVS